MNASNQPEGQYGRDGHHPRVSGPVPDIEAGEPSLSVDEGQRINRRALAFLGGIVGLLLLSTAVLFKHAGARQDGVEHVREQRVVVPELPAQQWSGATEDSAQSEMPEADGMALPPLPMEIDPAPPAPPATPNAMAEQPRVPSLLERRMQGDAQASSRAPRSMPPLDPYTQSLLDTGIVTPQASKSNAVAESPASATSARRMDRPDAMLARGTYIRCMLETRIVTDIPGFTSCVVTEPVYSINGRRRLLPQGSRMLGRYDQEPTGPRVGVIWDRILTPEGVDVTMSSPGVDTLGGAGHPGHYNAHWGSRLGAALLISLLSDAFSYAAAEHGPPTTSAAYGVVTQTPFESATARTMERLASQALGRATSRPPTVTLHQGTMVTVYVANDVDFSGVLPDPRR